MDEFVRDLVKRYPVLAANEKNINMAYTIIKRSFEAGKKLLIAGNGGSSSDADHIVGELMK